jgi:hypothetical protein
LNTKPNTHTHTHTRDRETNRERERERERGTFVCAEDQEGIHAARKPLLGAAFFFSDAYACKKGHQSLFTSIEAGDIHEKKKEEKLVEARALSLAK